MAKEATGYVIKKARKGNYFLSRSGRFVKHSDRGSTLGANRAWVHSGIAVALLRGQDLIDNAMLFPARYNPSTELTEVIGKSIMFDEFIASV